MKSRSIIILVAIALAFSGLTLILYPNLTNYEVRQVPMQIQVAEKLGFNTDPGDLNFGANFPGNTNKRFMEISFEKRTRVIIELEGDFAPWVQISDDDFILEADETKQLTFTAYIPEEAEEGDYTGTAIFYFKRP